jgi:hypothetical protein
MFIGTRQRKNFRKETKYLRPPSAYQNGPRVRHPSPCTGTNRGHGPLLQRGKRLSAWERLVAAMPGFVRPHSRHSALDQSLPRSAVRPHSVIPAEAGIHVYRNETTEGLPEGNEMSPATFSRSKWTPGQARLFFPVIPAKAEPALDSIRGIHVQMDPGSSPGLTEEERGMDPGSSPGLTGEEGGMDPRSSPGVTQEQAQRCGWTFYEAVFDEGPAGEPMPERRQPSSF